MNKPNYQIKQRQPHRQRSGRQLLCGEGDGVRMGLNKQTNKNKKRTNEQQCGDYRERGWWKWKSGFFGDGENKIIFFKEKRTFSASSACYLANIC